jgi:hypothetical protein
MIIFSFTSDSGPHLGFATQNRTYSPDYSMGSWNAKNFKLAPYHGFLVFLGLIVYQIRAYHRHLTMILDAPTPCHLSVKANIGSALSR